MTHSRKLCYTATQSICWSLTKSSTSLQPIFSFHTAHPKYFYTYILRGHPRGIPPSLDSCSLFYPVFSFGLPALCLSGHPHSVHCPSSQTPWSHPFCNKTAFSSPTPVIPAGCRCLPGFIQLEWHFESQQPLLRRQPHLLPDSVFPPLDTPNTCQYRHTNLIARRFSALLPAFIFASPP